MADWVMMGVVGKCTTTNKPVIDYTIASPELFNEIEDFQILDLNNFMSDVHNAMVFSLISSKKDPKNIVSVERVSKTKWEGAKSCDFLKNIDIQEIDRLSNLLENLNPNDISEESNVDLFIQKTNDILEKAKSKTFQPKTFVPSTSNGKSWYDKELTTAKNKFRSTRKKKSRKY